jgi:hypothetical protein
VRVLGIIVLIVGFLSKIAIVWTRGIIALLVGAAPAIAGGGPGSRRPTPLLVSGLPRRG